MSKKLAKSAAVGLDIELLKTASEILARWPLSRCRVVMDALAEKIVAEQAPTDRKKCERQLTMLRFEKVGNHPFFAAVLKDLRFGCGCKSRTWLRHFNTLAKLASALEQRALKPRS